ncbi:hypothetical protein [Altericista sp. CCNU0014]|uniref:hypothetical protein n=1 Tax=Altericista sp. CCNU0014 TaxID=3082949 RepID=UPI00384E4C2A
MRYRNAVGLSYVEVMVSMLTSALFLSTTLQAYVAATGLRVKTRQADAAIASIQADVESIRQMAQALPSNAADCQLPPSGSYAQQIMQSIANKDRVALNVLVDIPPEVSVSTIAPNEDRPIVMEQVATLPMAALPGDYRMQRTLSVDTSGLPSEQVLQIAYRVVLREPAEVREGDSVEDPPANLNLSEPTVVAQLNAAILPNAAMVCF